ncbi:hypothetical protein [Polaribacter sargassicola]|uniref:hypothetical protein n=1 Tax=Polaribacter sargassicola TaxID=2836891 RepID=UPI001F1F4921|nr:hypothetical protein [Polaribacter sp. DS7-9]MCG1035221.1 hypothetical protein [Polaribacter sp. DS7-9]
MKKLILLIIICTTFSSCFYFYEESENGGGDPFFSNYTPVVLDRNEFENSIEILEPIPVAESSKIYIINDYIFINDKRTGFHIFDNTDPSNPIKKKFLKIPGATDIAIRNDVLYINQATDLVVLTIDFTTLEISLNKRLKDVFPALTSPEGEWYYYEDEVVVNWILK